MDGCFVPRGVGNRGRGRSYTPGRAMSDPAPPLPCAEVLSLAVLSVVAVGALSLALFGGDIVEDENDATEAAAVELGGDDFERADADGSPRTASTGPRPWVTGRSRTTTPRSPPAPMDRSPASPPCRSTCRVTSR